MTRYCCKTRAAGENWQPIASKHFPNKTANACRKRHERLIERHRVEDWDSRKLDLLAQEYLAIRQEMWEMLAERVGEKWQVVEAKCMEKGLKTLQATTRMAARKASVTQSQYSNHSGGISSHNSDSGFDVGAEMEAVEALGHFKSGSWDSQLSNGPEHLPESSMHKTDRFRALSLPQPLPLYQPPPPLASSMAMIPQSSYALYESTNARAIPSEIQYSAHRHTMLRSSAILPQSSPSRTTGRTSTGISIQSVLAPATTDSRPL